MYLGGYKLKFCSLLPPCIKLSKLPTSPMQLFCQGAIAIVQKMERFQDYHSNLFTFPKANGASPLPFFIFLHEGLGPQWCQSWAVPCAQYHSICFSTFWQCGTRGFSLNHPICLTSRTWLALVWYGSKIWH